jgi:hypothetical protein
VYSRYAPGWLLADCESAELAQELVLHTCEKQNISLGQLTLHAGGVCTSTQCRVKAAQPVAEADRLPRRFSQ